MKWYRFLRVIKADDTPYDRIYVEARNKTEATTVFHNYFTTILHQEIELYRFLIGEFISLKSASQYIRGALSPNTTPISINKFLSRSEILVIRRVTP